MGVREFMDLADAVIDRLAPEIAEGRARSIRRSAGAGSWGVAISELVAVLAHEHTPVTPEDREALLRLLERLGEPVEDIDQLNVAASERKFEVACDQLLDLVLPVVGKQQLVTVGQLRAGGEFFQALLDLVLIADREHIDIPRELRDRILADVDSLNTPDHPDVEDIKLALGTPAA